MEHCNNIEHLKALYEQNGTMTRLYLEWRHRLMVRYFVVISMVGGVTAWSYNINMPNRHILLAVVAVLAAVVCIALLAMEISLTHQARVGLSVGMQLEFAIIESAGLSSDTKLGHFAGISEWFHNTRLKHTYMLRFVYLLSSIILVIGGILQLLGE